MPPETSPSVMMTAARLEKHAKPSTIPRSSAIAGICVMCSKSAIRSELVLSGMVDATI